MTTTINASTSSGLVVTPDNSGNIVLQYNGQSAPCFSAWPSSITSVADSTWTKLTWGTESWDTNSNFASSTFTPTVAGYYQINACMRYASAFNASQQIIAIYKNGSVWTRGSGTGTASAVAYLMVSGIVYCNGSTDYIEIYTYQNSGSSQNNDNSSYYNFSGCLLRGA